MSTVVGMLPGASAHPTEKASAHPADNPDAVCSGRLPEHKNIRAVFHDYSGGDYFVTICTYGKEHFFGEIRNNDMVFSEIGIYAKKCLEELPVHYKYVRVPIFVVMPNHIHAIIHIFESADASGSIPTIRTALGVVVGGYKQAVTRYARRNNIEFAWQKRFHDHIIRGINDGNRIAEYIKDNVLRWAADCYNRGR